MWTYPYKTLPYEHQRNALRESAEKNSWAYFMEMGTGKTKVTIDNIALCISRGQFVPDHYKLVFDHIIEIPEETEYDDINWKIDNKWKYYQMTPFDETVILDCDMIFTEDISHWWDTLSTKDVLVTTNVKTYRHEISTSDYYRKTFVSNNLQKIYTAFMYFKKSDLAEELFNTVELISKYREIYYYEFLDETRPSKLSGDVAFSLAMKLLDIENECVENNIKEIPSFVHMKSYNQNINEKLIEHDWTKNIPTYFTSKMCLKIGNFQQHLPFH